MNVVSTPVPTYTTAANTQSIEPTFTDPSHPGSHGMMEAMDPGAASVEFLIGGWGRHF
jgi:hypothetical protein